jgi:uncharacterized protein (TIGR03067 family)
MLRTPVAALTLLGLVGAGLAEAANQTPDVRAPLETWRLVAVVADGTDVEVGRATLMTVTPEGYAVTVDGKPYQKGTVKVDSAKAPLQSDIRVAEGADAGKTLRQISKVEGDVLIACIARPGAARHTEFTSKPGSGHTLSVWIRVK